MHLTGKCLLNHQKTDTKMNDKQRQGFQVCAKNKILNV